MKRLLSAMVGFASRVGYELISLCNLCVLCVSVVGFAKKLLTAETQRPQRLHREERADDFWGKAAMVLCIVSTTAGTSLAQSPCKVGVQAPPVGFSAWAPGSEIKVYVLENHFENHELPFLLTALDTWNTVSDTTDSRVRFVYKGTTASQLYCENCLTIRRGSVFDKSKRHLATLRASSGARNQIINWANITIDPLLTNPRTLTNALAHELGHSFGLLDCYSCKAGSTVMIKFEGVNVPNEMDGPSGCDLAQVKAVYQSLALELKAARSRKPIVVDEGEEAVEDDTPVVIPKP